MKNIKTFEAWSSKFNRTLQGAYQQSQVTNKGFGKSAKAVLDYANRSISQEVFSVEFKGGLKVIFTHDPEFILKPIETFIKENGDLSKDKNYLIIPIKVKKYIGSDGKIMGSLDDEESIRYGKDKNILLFKDGKITGYRKNRDSSGIGDQDMELRFSDRKGIENFFAMTIQAVLSSPEQGKPIKRGSELFSRFNSKGEFEEDVSGMPGDTIEKQTIMALIQKHILDKDQRQYTM